MAKPDKCVCCGGELTSEAMNLDFPLCPDCERNLGEMSDVADEAAINELAEMDSTDDIFTADEHLEEEFNGESDY